MTRRVPVFQGRQIKTRTMRDRSGDAVYDYAWRQLRKRVLHRQPWCNACERKIATEVDHIEPIDKRPELRLEESNLQPLCKACHREKTSREQREKFSGRSQK